MKKILILLILSICLISGCAENSTPFNVSFKNQTLKNSPNTTIFTVYAEDKRIRDKYTDIYVKADSVVDLTITKELSESYDITIAEPDKWYSLTNLINKHLDLVTFAKVESTVFIINSTSQVTLTLKAVGGDLVYHLDTGENSLTNTFDVSKEFEVKINQSN